ncbi:MAG TPA: OmpA family protein [Steroidobacteraceae bacterium]|nr:OmpA family protein [Steroidobacteraceae bacterium]
MTHNNRFPLKIMPAAIAVAIFSANAQSADETGMWYLNPQAGYTFLDNSRDVDDDFHYGFGFGYHFTPHFSLEFNGLFGDFEGDAGRTLHQNAYSADGLFVFGRENRVSPFLSLGAGYLENNFAGNDDWNGLLGQAGVGLLIDAGDSDSFLFQFRPEVKYRHDWPSRPHASDDGGDILVNLGFAFNFGPHGAAPIPVAQTPPPPPPPAPPPPPPKPVDSDGDGVPDTADQCPGTARGVQVDDRGCPREPVILRGVDFESNAATLKPESRPVLDEVAADLKKHPQLRVELQGHTDSRGADAYNLDLSQRRANSVRDYLVSQGVNPGQLVPKGYGETQPIADNATASGRAENRRVVMRVLANPTNVDVEGGGAQ